MFVKNKIIIILISFTILISTFSAATNETRKINDKEYNEIPQETEPIKTDRIIVKLKENIEINTKEKLTTGEIKTGIQSLDTINKEYQVNSIQEMFQIKNTNTKINPEILEKTNLKNTYKFSFSQKNNIKSAIDQFNSLSDIVEYAEPDYEARICAIMDYPENETHEYNDTNEIPDDFPNDPGWPVQWHMHEPEHGGINAREAWKINTGDGACVAVLDTGVDQLSDLSETNFVQGWDFANDDFDPSDDHGHGTHVAGTIAQSTNNEKGVCGVAFDTSLMPIKVLDYHGTGYLADVADGIYYATVYGADVISMSIGSTFDSTPVREAVEFASEMGVTLVAAAGNSGSSNLHYPARYHQVISVGATQYDKTKAFYSCFGNGLDVVAPGGNTKLDQNNDSWPDGVLQQTCIRPWVSCNSGCGYYFMMGTSMACPHVSGIAALLYSMGFSKYEVESRIKNTAHDLGPEGWDKLYGHGLVDAYRATQKPFRPADPQPAIQSEEVDLNIELSVYVEDPDDDFLNVTFHCRIGKSIDGTIVEPFIIGNVTDVNSGSRVSIEWNNLLENTRYGWYVTVDDGEDTASSRSFSFQTKSAQGPPYIPSNPYPEDNSNKVSTNVVLSFDGGDPSLLDEVTYDLYFSNDENPEYNTTIGTYDAHEERITYSLDELKENTKYYWKIEAQDSDGNITEGPIWCFTTVNPVDSYPTAYFSWNDDDATGSGTLINFDASNSYDNNGITSYEWDLDDDGTIDKTGLTINHDFNDYKNHTVTLKVTDTIGQTDLYSDIVKATGSEIDNPPLAFFIWEDTDENGPGSVISFNASLSSDDYGITSYEWDLDDDGTIDKTGLTINHDFNDYKNHTVTLKVTDNIEQTDTYNSTVRAINSSNNQPPVASFSWSDLDGPDEGTEIRFDASMSTDDFGINSYQWDLDNDGIYDKTGETITHDFHDTEPHIVKLKVTDTLQQFDVRTETVQAESNPDDVNIEIIKPNNGLYIRNKKIISLPVTFIIGDIDIQINVTKSSSVQITNLSLKVDNQEKENISYNPENTSYNFSYKETAFFKKTINITAYNGEQKIESKTLDFFIFNINLFNKR